MQADAGLAEEDRPRRRGRRSRWRGWRTGQQDEQRGRPRAMSSRRLMIRPTSGPDRRRARGPCPVEVLDAARRQIARSGSSIGIRTILPSSSQRRAIASMRWSSSAPRQTATSSTIRWWRMSSMSSRCPSTGRWSMVVGASPTARKPITRSPSSRWRRDPVGEPARLASGADHEHVAQVIAAVAQPPQQPADRGPRGDREHDLGHEQGQQKKSADVRQLDHEQAREDDEA